MKCGAQGVSIQVSEIQQISHGGWERSVDVIVVEIALFVGSFF